MSRTFETEVQVGEERQRVEVTLPEGYLTPEEVAESYLPKDTVERRIEDRVRRVRSGLADPDELLSDDKFLRRAAKERRDKLVEYLGIDPEGREVDLERQFERWEQEHVKPLREELGTKDDRVQRLLARRRDAQVIEASRKHGVRDSMVDVVPMFIRDRLRYDDEFDDFFVVGTDGDFEYTGRPQKGRAPYKTVEELIEELERSGERDDWFEPQGRRGAGYNGGDRRSSTVTLDDFEKMSSSERRKVYDRNPGLYREHMDALGERNRDKFTARGR